MQAQLIALDWGTSSLRAYKLGPAGVVLEQRALASGIMHLPSEPRDIAGVRCGNGFELAFDAACGDWLDAEPGLPVIACGMVGSAQGWSEAAYRPTPVDVASLGQALHKVRSLRGVDVHIVPGVIEQVGLPNVMRGEETQVLGVLQGLGADMLIGLPGSHSKWVEVVEGRITHFDTFMTGEVFAVLSSTASSGVPSNPANDSRPKPSTAAYTWRAPMTVSAACCPPCSAPAPLGSPANSPQTSSPTTCPACSSDMSSPACPTAPNTSRSSWSAPLLSAPVINAPSPSAALPTSAWRRKLPSAACGNWPWRQGSLNLYWRPDMLKQALAQNGLIAILRGIRPDEAEAVGQVLYQAGFRVIEVPLNSPDPYTSIRTLRASLPADCLIGAGTVLLPEQVEQVKAAGGQVVVMPHSDAKVLRAAKAAGLFLSPGVATPTEAFAALAEGADVLKLFPAEQMGPSVIKAWLAVLPAGTLLLPVGGITPDNMQVFTDAGAKGFGLGSGLFKPGMTVDQVASRAQAYVAAWKALG